VWLPIDAVTHKKGPHYRSDKCWHDIDGIRVRHFCAKMSSRLMSIVMIVVVVVEHEGACVRARVMRWRAIHAMTKEMRFQGSALRWTLFTDFYFCLYRNSTCNLAC
jgi:hypothetical protein